MITISQHVEQWVARNPFLREQLGKGLINHSALARYIRPHIKEATGESVSLEAITIALNRLGKSLAGRPNIEHALKYLGDVSVQTGLSILVVQTTALDTTKLHPREYGDFFVISQGIWHTAVITKSEMLKSVDFKPEDVVMQTDDLTGLTVKLEDGNMDVPGICSLVLQVLANKAISLHEVVSTHNELTVLLDQKEAQRALATIIDLKTHRFPQMLGD